MEGLLKILLQRGGILLNKQHSEILGSRLYLSTANKVCKDKLKVDHLARLNLQTNKECHSYQRWGDTGVGSRGVV